jgi:hypothetical protein
MTQVRDSMNIAFSSILNVCQSSVESVIFGRLFLAVTQGTPQHTRLWLKSVYRLFQAEVPQNTATAVDV